MKQDYNRIALVGIEQEEYDIIKAQYSGHIIWHQSIPKIVVKDEVLYMEKSNGIGMLPVDKVVYYGIYDNDFDFISGLAIWGGACYPNAAAMLDCRFKIPCLVKALAHSKFSAPRGFISAGTSVNVGNDTVAKWGNWHCGENKHRFTGEWESEFTATTEPYYEGEAVRIMIIGNVYWQIKLEGDSWLKSIHPDNAGFMDVDSELLADTLHIKNILQMDMIGNDYIVAKDGSKYLLEVNHIPNITRFEEVRQVYLSTVIDWIN
ncbi:hypothetical protein FLA105534_02647 [Flavobacterium bizetiae]|uniref:ATP-grasp fold RimK-type domain-containing protein n=1 Tax=Flavobacterium bizetiae TaxID=2704140 RepID=A0A6J4GK01_9FLAO|nr:hypothetical protein [Flavobacterium bizetiae]CAA9199503.1 hypothetical protein FLA105534_02647 [Flavobacterium bizetiae]CAD5341232.1 hypothetical protein FLA105535_01199 [Flavobacterium bizetiae]CAD5349030.1 hypothetical protein FLA105534_03010 [Flavobacterium bizetiae]